MRILTAACALASAGTALGQISASGLGTNVSQSGGAWSITAGTRVGGNLFHSFSSFSIPTGNSATFSGPGSVQHIIGRVTGPDASSIDGLLRSTIPGADLWLINPRGVSFGPNASLSVQGSFHVSTADYLKLGSTGQFNATNPGGSTLVSAPPSAFGFLGAPSGISVTGATLTGRAGESFSLVGGDLTFASATVQAPAGRLNLASVRSAGEVSLDAAGIGTSGVTAYGDILATSSTLDSSPQSFSFSPSGPVYVAGGNFTMSQSTLRSDNDSFGSSDGGDLNLRLSGTLRITGEGITAKNLAFSKGGDIRVDAAAIDIDGGGKIETSTSSFSDAGGDVAINAGSIRLSDGALIASSTVSLGNAGSVALSADSLDISDRAGVSANTSGSGNAGNVSVTARAVDLRSGGFIGSSTFAGGLAGSVSLAVDERLFISGVGTTGFSSGVFATVGAGATGNAGSVNVSAGSVEVRAGGAISATTFGAGLGGNVHVQATDTVRIQGDTPDGSSVSGIFASSQGAATEDAGKVRVEAASIVLKDGGAISGASFGEGGGGSAEVRASGSLRIAGKSTQGFLSGVFASTEAGGDAGSVDVEAGSLTIGYGGGISGQTRGSGRAGGVTVRAGEITLRDGGVIKSPTIGGGNGGDVSVIATNRLLIEGMGADGFSSGIFATSFADATGDAGKIHIEAGTIVLRNGGAISGATFGSGRGGGVDASVANRLLIDGSDGSATGIFSTTSGTNAGEHGDGGSVKVQAKTIEILNGGGINASTYNEGHGGSVEVTASGSLRIAGKTPSGQFFSGIFAGANASGHGGPLSVTARTIDLGEGSTISADSASVGNAGSVTVRADEIRLHDGGFIQSAAFGAGRGGDAFITARSLLFASGVSSDGLSHSGISVHSSHTATETGAAGTLTVTAGAIELHGGAQINAATFGSGKGGPMTIDVGGKVLVEGVSSDGFSSGIFASTSGSGTGGTITLRAADVEVRGGGLISTTASGDGRGGNAELTVANTLSISGVAEGRFHSTVAAESRGKGAAGSLTITAGSIDLSDGGEISTSSFAGGDGGTGTITAGTIRIAGVGSDNGRSGIFASATGAGRGGSLIVKGDTINIADQGIISASTLAAGTAGNVMVEAGDLTLVSGGWITSSTDGTGDGGSVSVTASRSIVMTDGLAGSLSGVFTDTSAGGDAGFVSVSAPSIVIGSRAAIGADTFASGRGGDISVSAGDISILNGGSVTASTYGPAPSGSVHVAASGRLTIAGLDADGFPAGIFAASYLGSTGKAGSIFVDAGSIDITGGGISAATYTTASAGNVVVKARDISIAGAGLIESSASGGGNGGNVDIVATGTLRVSGTDSGISAASFDADGKGGSIFVTAKDIVLADGGQIAAFSLGTGIAGSIRLVVADTLRLDSASAISTEAASENGGNIDVRAGRLVYLKDSSITTSVDQDKGAGGNITIDPTFVVLDGGRIEARAAEGRGGNISIVSDFFLNFGGVISASSEKGISGTVEISSPNVDVGTGLVVLSGGYLDASRLIRASCASRVQGSTLVAGARGGVAHGPEPAALGAGLRTTEIRTKACPG